MIELMVVLFVMALLAGAAVLALPGDDRALRHEAERFAVRASAARDEAITAGVPVAQYTVIETDEHIAVGPGAPATPVEALPDAALQFLLQSLLTPTEN